MLFAHNYAPCPECLVHLTRSTSRADLQSIKSAVLIEALRQYTRTLTSRLYARTRYMNE